MTVDEFLGRLEKVTKTGTGWMARCPAHEDRRASLSVGVGADDRILVNCQAGCPVTEVVAKLNLQLSDLFVGGGGSATPRDSRATGQHTAGRGCTIAAYAAAKGLDVGFLESLGISEIRFQGAPAVRFPYLSEDGVELCIRYRVALDGDLRVRTKAGMKHCLYGLNRLRHPRELGYVLIVEGESDTQTLWQHQFPALGLPGANGWIESRDADALEGIGTVYVLIEPDRGGEAVLRWVAASSIRERVRLVTLEGAKDISELYLVDRDRFRERVEAALQAAAPWAEHERIATEIRFRTSWKECAELARETDLLARFVDDVADDGLAGEARAAKLIYLILTSRFLPRPVSAAIKGPSSGGKSFVLASVLDYFPINAYYSLAAMSEHALAYGTEPLSHRFLILYEAAGADNEFVNYLVRSLLSEGRLRYETVEKTANGLEPRLIEREGPTGLLTTTTRVALHPENETRLLSIPITDTQDQTKDVLKALANETARTSGHGQWVSLQEWLATAEHRVTVPYSTELAELVPPVAVRLRRDFGALLALIRTHALLHQARRDRADSGAVVASFADYQAVRELVVDLVSEGVGATVQPIVRETVEAVAGAEDAAGISIGKLADLLGIDKSAASRRWQAAKAGSYLKNLETGRGKPARIVVADPLPGDVQVLPKIEQLAERCTVARESEGVSTPPPPDEWLVQISEVELARLQAIGEEYGLT